MRRTVGQCKGPEVDLTTVEELYEYSCSRYLRFMRSFARLKSEGARIIANGFKAAGITQSVVDCRCENVDSLNDTFSGLSFIDYEVSLFTTNFPYCNTYSYMTLLYFGKITIFIYTFLSFKIVQLK